MYYFQNLCNQSYEQDCSKWMFLVCSLTSQDITVKYNKGYSKVTYLSTPD